MFTGLVQALGRIRDSRPRAAGIEVSVDSSFEDYVAGESIAVDGVCLTVTRFHEHGFVAHASEETVSRTTLGQRTRGDRVHLERALRVGDPLGGHVVSGHVDGVGQVVSMDPVGEAVRTSFEVPQRLAAFLAPKGSVTLDGVSLTVNAAVGTRFDVMLVPFTLGETTFEGRGVGAEVNVEVDVLAKYVARLLGRAGVDGVPVEGAPAVTLDLLRRAGYL